MGTIYISENAYEEVTSYIRSLGHDVAAVRPNAGLSAPVAAHADLSFCRLGIAPDAPVFRGDTGRLGPVYPDDVRFCAACTGKYIICNARITDPGLLGAAEEAGMTLVNVRQGYARCSTLIAGEENIITSDEGICRECVKAGLSALLISPGGILLPGYEYGFIGGASGRIGGEIIFNGDISGHRDFSRIKDFISGLGLSMKWFPGLPLTDIGSIV